MIFTYKDIKSIYYNGFQPIVANSCHQVIQLFSNLLILKICGLEYSGKLALVAVSSMYLSLFILRRLDVEVLLSPNQFIAAKVKVGYRLILNSTIPLLIISIVENFFFDKTLVGLIFCSSLFISLIELQSSALFKTNRLWSYFFIKISTPIFMLVFALLNIDPVRNYLFSFFITMIISLSLTAKIWPLYIIKVWSYDKKLLTYNFFPTLNSCLASSISYLWILIIGFNFGPFLVGIWVNSIRFFLAIPALMIGAIMPLLLKNIGSDRSSLYALKAFFIFIMSMFFLTSIIYLLYLSLFTEMNNFLYKEDLLDYKLEILMILACGFFHLIIHNLQPLFQFFKRDKDYFLSIFISLIFSVILLFFLQITFYKLIVIIMISGLLTLLCLLYLSFINARNRK